MNIKELRKSLNWSKQELADYLGVNSRTVRRWESGGSVPSPLAWKGLWYLRMAVWSGKVKPHSTHRGLLKRLIDRLLGGR